MTLVRAVLRYRYKFIDCAAGAVPNNRHDLDLLSDDDCRGARGQLVMTRPKSRLRRDKSRPVASTGGSGAYFAGVQFANSLDMAPDQWELIALSLLAGPWFWRCIGPR